MKTASLHCLLGVAGSGVVVTAMALFNAVAGANLPVQLMASVLVPTTAAISAAMDPLSRRLQDYETDTQTLKQQILTDALVEKLIRFDTDAQRYTQLPVPEGSSVGGGEPAGGGSGAAGQAPLSRGQSQEFPVSGCSSAPDGEIEPIPEVRRSGLRLVSPTVPQAPSPAEVFAAKAIPFPLGKRSPAPESLPRTAAAGVPIDNRSAPDDASGDDIWGDRNYSAV